jgi:protein tyrosine/serine phosphatase
MKAFSPSEWRPKRLVRNFAIGLLALLLLGGAYLGELQLTENFHTVVAGQLYRSGQPTAETIDEYAKAYGIKTIINLRGSNIGKSWYDAEVGEAKRLGIAHVDFGMSARRELTAAKAAELITLMKGAQKPILIHCKAGADRSGLASALYLAAIARAGEAAAEGQLSIRFGHFSLPFFPEFAMDRTFEALEPSLGVRSDQVRR